MAPSYKLTYFDLRARGEVSRLLFAQAGVKFEDHRITFEEWGKIKPTTPFGSLPVLEVDGKKLWQSMAVASYLAREFGLYGKSNMDGHIIDQVQQQREDLLVAMAKVQFCKDEAEKSELQKKMNEETIPKFFKYFCNVIKENNGGGQGFVVGKKLSLADLVIYEGTQVAVEKDPSLLEQYMEIKALRSMVEASPNIKKYLASRKKTDF